MAHKRPYIQRLRAEVLNRVASLRDVLGGPRDVYTSAWYMSAVASGPLVDFRKGPIPVDLAVRCFLMQGVRCEDV